MKYIIALVISLLSFSTAFAADLACPELNTIQRWAGYLSWMGFLKVCGVVAVAAGVCFFFAGFINWAIKNLWALIEKIADILGYIVSVTLIVLGAFTPTEYQLWPVLGGCILFGGSVLLTIRLRKIKEYNPSEIFAILAVVWGAVAIYYEMHQIGFLTVAAFMGVLGFSVAVSPFCYSFGFRKDEEIAAATGASLLMLVLYVLENTFFPNAPAAIQVFEAGTFWLASFVAFLGLLILSNRWYVVRKRSEYAWMQFVAVAWYMVGVASGMILGINPLAGMAGTFLVFYVAAKLIEIKTDSAMTFGLQLISIGVVFSSAWFLASRNEAFVKLYLTTTLPN